MNGCAVLRTAKAAAVRLGAVLEVHYRSAFVDIPVRRRLAAAPGTSRRFAYRGLCLSSDIRPSKFC
jgi:hypothetical protein